jgi:2-polyprenyl-3-methyl-5-hydroxy-6-metoxy-1,4-benzoquinol methylase
LPAEGEGRNAVYAAKLGWEVVAFDQSEAGEKKAMQLAEATQTSISYRIEDAMDFNEANAFDLIFYGFFHVPPTVLQPVYDHLNTFVKPNGLILLEGFSTKNMGRGSGGPQNEAMLFTTSRVKSLLHDFKTLKVWEEEIILNEGPFHQGNACVIRAIGVK